MIPRDYKTARLKRLALACEHKGRSQGLLADVAEEEMFGDFDRRVPIFVRCHPGLREALNQYAAGLGLSQNEAARLLLAERLKELGTVPCAQ